MRSWEFQCKKNSKMTGDSCSPNTSSATDYAPCMKPSESWETRDSVNAGQQSQLIFVRISSEIVDCRMRRASAEGRSNERTGY